MVITKQSEGDCSLHRTNIHNMLPVLSLPDSAGLRLILMAQQLQQLVRPAVPEHSAPRIKISLRQ